MKRAIAIILALALGIASWGQGIASRCEHFTTKHKGHEREYLLYTPEGLKPGASLVMALHGYGGNMYQSIPEDLLNTADRHGFMVCIPQGLKDTTGHTCWNVGYPFQAGWKVDDVAFVSTLSKKIRKQHGLGAGFLTGMSNGGEMCYLTAMRKPKAFAAIASIAGLTMQSMVEEYSSTGPVPFMEVHGNQDHTSEWLGDPSNKGGWGAYLPVTVAVSRVISEDRCQSQTIETLPQREGRNLVTLYKFGDGTPAANGRPMEVWLYKVDGGNHSWSLKDMDTCEAIWEFFSLWE
jgi:Poly(3-hydroxybutyrate) depolymerase